MEIKAIPQLGNGGVTLLLLPVSAPTFALIGGEVLTSRVVVGDAPAPLVVTEPSAVTTALVDDFVVAPAPAVVDFLVVDEPVVGAEDDVVALLVLVLVVAVVLEDTVVPAATLVGFGVVELVNSHVPAEQNLPESQSESNHVELVNVRLIGVIYWFTCTCALLTKQAILTSVAQHVTVICVAIGIIIAGTKAVDSFPTSRSSICTIYPDPASSAVSSICQCGREAKQDIKSYK